MECPECGYLMDAFEASCPRCERLGEQAKPATATVTAPQQPDAASEIIANYNPNRPRPQAPSQTMSPTPVPRMVQRPPLPTGPVLGWPLTIMLWIYVVLLGGLLLLFALGMILAQSSMHNEADSTQFGGAGMILISGPALMLCSAIAMLRCKIWGLWVFTIFTIAPLALSLAFSGLTLGTTMALIVNGPALAIIILGFMKRDEMD